MPDPTRPDPDSHLAIGPYDRDDDLLRDVRAGGRPLVTARAFDRTLVVLGRGSRPQVELHLEACRADDVAVSRRAGGGCAVVLDPGNVIVSLAAPMRGFGDLGRQWQRLTAWMIDALAAVGHPGLAREGISDLARSDRKVGGASLYRTADLLYFATTLLVRPEVDLMERWLAHPPREPAWRRGRRHAEFVGALARGASDDASTLAADLCRVLAPPDLAR
jgi:lipoate---protein ligase